MSTTDVNYWGPKLLLQKLVNVPEKIIPIIIGELELGEFGRIYFADFDQVRARERTVMFQVIGE